MAEVQEEKRATRRFALRLPVPRGKAEGPHPVDDHDLIQAGQDPGRLDVHRHDLALEEQRNGEWRYLEFLQVTSWILADIFMREIPGGTRARHRSRPVDLPEHRY